MTNEAEGIWYEFHDQLRAFIARRVDNGADVEDILQNVFLRVHQSLGTLNRADRLASWLYQVTRNAIADYYRAAERRREIPTDFTLETEADRDGVQENSGINLLDFEEQRAKAIEELADCLRPWPGWTHCRLRMSVFLMWSLQGQWRPGHRQSCYSHRLTVTRPPSSGSLHLQST